MDVSLLHALDLHEIEYLINTESPLLECLAYKLLQGLAKLLVLVTYLLPSTNTWQVVRLVYHLQHIVLLKCS